MKKIITGMDKVEGAVAALGIFLMAFFVVMDVVLREIFNTGMPWMNKSAVYLMSWCGYLGVVAVASKAGHLRPHFADKFWSKHPKVFVRVQNSVMLLFNIFFAYVGIKYVMQSYDFGDINVVLKLPLWIIQLIIPYAFFSISLRNLFFIAYPDEQLAIKQEIA